MREMSVAEQTYKTVLAVLAEGWTATEVARGLEGQPADCPRRINLEARSFNPACTRVSVLDIMLMQ